MRVTLTRRNTAGLDHGAPFLTSFSPRLSVQARPLTRPCSALFVKRRQPPNASGERTEPSHPGPRLSHPMVQGIPSPPTRDRPPPPSRATQAHERQFDGIIITVSRCGCLGKTSQLEINGMRIRFSTGSEAAHDAKRCSSADVATVSERCSGEGSQRSNQSGLRARCPGLGRKDQKLHDACAGRRCALAEVGRRADLLLGLLRRQHDGVLSCSVLSVSSGGMQSDAQCLVSAFGRRWCERAEQ